MSYICLVGTLVLPLHEVLPDLPHRHFRVGLHVDTILIDEAQNDRDGGVPTHSAFVLVDSLLLDVIKLYRLVVLLCYHLFRRGVPQLPLQLLECLPQLQLALLLWPQWAPTRLENHGDSLFCRWLPLNGILFIGRFL
jgi:hypothetical protein